MTDVNQNLAIQISVTKADSLYFSKLFRITRSINRNQLLQLKFRYPAGEPEFGWNKDEI